MESTIEITSKVLKRKPVITVTGKLFRFRLGSKVKLVLTAGKTVTEKEITLTSISDFETVFDRSGLPNGPYRITVTATDAFAVEHTAETTGVIRGEGSVLITNTSIKGNKVVCSLLTKNLPNKIQAIRVVMRDKSKSVHKQTVYHNPFMDGELVIPKPDGLTGLTTIMLSIMDWRQSAVHVSDVIQF